MGRTQVRGLQVRDGSIQQKDLDVVTPGEAVITKVVAGSNISLSSTGVDAGTGEVTVNVTGLSTVATSGSYTDLINKPDAAETLEQLNDVAVVTPVDGDVLVYDGGTNSWKNTKEDSDPVFDYTDGDLTQITYSNGNYKILSYVDGNLSEIVYYAENRTVTKTFSYNPDGTLASIDQSEIYN